jgi:hypothetical protein
MLEQYIGDNKTHQVPLTWEEAAFTPGGTWGLTFTAKRKATDPDADAVIQKASGVGLSASDSTASIVLVPDDSNAFKATRQLYCAIRATHSGTGETRTVWADKIKFERAPAHLPTTTIPVITTTDPAPFAGDVTTAAVLAALGVPSYATVAAANAALAIGKIYYDTTLATLNVTTA